MSHIKPCVPPVGILAVERVQRHPHIHLHDHRRRRPQAGIPSHAHSVQVCHIWISVHYHLIEICLN